MASEDAVYRQSSQFRLWSFSPAQLADVRGQTNALAKESISERRQAAAAAEEEEPPEEDGHETAYLTPAEERLLLDFYTVELLRAGKFTEQPTDVQATAAVFLRRFYVTHSIMTYPPAALFKTALFFGAKAEGYYHKLDGFAEKFPHTTAADILAGEFLLCQGIRFAFDVKHPFRALEGAVMELRRLADAQTDNSGTGGGLDDTRIGQAHKRAREILKFSPLVTDAYFHYTPSQIMLAALWLADRGLVERLLLREAFRRDRETDNGAGAGSGAAAANSKKSKKSEAEWEKVNGAEIRDRAMATIAACSQMLATEPPERFTEYWGKPESNNIIKPLLKKLKNCRDPDRSNLVALQQSKKEGSVKQYSSTHTTMEEDGAVFGSKGSLPASHNGSNNGSTSTPNSLHDAKRRKVAKALDDPFGPPLQR